MSIQFHRHVKPRLDVVVAAVGERVSALRERWQRRHPAPERRGSADHGQNRQNGRNGQVVDVVSLSMDTVPLQVAVVDAPANGRTARRRRKDAPPVRSQEPAVLQGSGITVQFGGLVAVDNVSLEVRTGEIVGLIGPNGAGKTTLFNAVSGLNRPTAGSVVINGADATAKRVHERASLGLARTFQVIQLFPQLDVFDNILIGTHLHSPGGLWSRLVLTRGAVEAELEAVERVDEVVRFFGLSDIRHSAVSSLSFGTLRMVELARAVVTGAPVIMLDEPASGLDNAETDRLSDFLRRLRVEFGVSILVIEHDVRMVTALTDYMYVIDRGKLIAEGTPSEIQSNETVIAAYLGGSAAHAPAAS